MAEELFYDPSQARSVMRYEKTGRKTKLTPERHNEIVELIKHGNYIEVAAAAVGIDQRTYYFWVATGKAVCEAHGIDADEWPDELDDYDRKCAQFYQDIRKATAQAEATAVLHIRKQMPEQWAAAMTYLERRFPGRWKRREEIVTQDPFEPTHTKDQGGIDETSLLNDPAAVSLMHEALAVIAGRGAGPKGDGAVEGEVVEGEDGLLPPAAGSTR